MSGPSHERRPSAVQGLSSARQHRTGDIRRSVLPHGLRLVTEVVPSAGSASVGFFVGTGSRHETPRQHGASHFLEHLLFKGTPSRAAEMISAEIEQVGGEINAYTAKEHTCFYAKVIGDDGPMAVEVLSDMFAHSLLSSSDMESEREVILDEIAMHADDPGEVADDLASARLLSGDALARSVIGSQRSVSDMTRRRVVNYWRRHYRADNVVISAAGAVNHDELLEQVRGLDQMLGREIRTTEAKRDLRRPPVMPRVITRTRPVEQSSAILGFRSPGRQDPRRAALRLLVLVLGGGMSSRLFVEVRERRGLVYAIDAAEAAYSDVGVVSIEWASHADRTPEIIRVVRDTINEVMDGGISAAELERAKGQLRGQLVLGYEAAGARMARNGISALDGDERSIGDLLEASEQVSLADLMAVASDVFCGPPVLAVVGPRPNRGKLERLIRTWPGGN